MQSQFFATSHIHYNYCLVYSKAENWLHVITYS